MTELWLRADTLRLRLYARLLRWQIARTRARLNAELESLL